MSKNFIKYKINIFHFFVFENLAMTFYSEVFADANTINSIM